MKVILKMREGGEVKLKPQATLAKADCHCPACGERLRVRGDRRRVSNCDRYYWSHGRCVACGAYVGEIRAYPDTLFGITEDERVLDGRYRVY